MRSLKLHQIQAHSLQPPARSQDTTELQESHRQIGVLRPPIVVPDGADGYICLAGWRTITAARVMGLKEMPCIVREDLVGDLDKQVAVFAQSNLHKELTVLERAEIIKSMIIDGRDLRHVARQMGVSVTEANHLLNLANAPSEVKELVLRAMVKGTPGLAWGTFKAELSNLSGEQMIERLRDAGDLSRRSLKRARQKATGTPERILEDTDGVLKIIQDIRTGLSKIEVFLRTSTPEAKDEVRVALGPVIELAVNCSAMTEEVRGESN